MRNAADQPLSYWRDTAPHVERAPLVDDTRAAVAVIGAGIAGLSAAYALAREGVSVVVVDSGPVASGMTERTSAHLSNAVDDRYVEIERRHGPEGARICAESHSAAIEFIAAVAESESIECAFERVDGFLFAPPDRTASERAHELESELQAARRAGLDGVQWVDRAPLAAFDTGRCLRFPRQAQFHPLRYVAGLAEALERHGGRIHCGTRVTRVDEGETTTTAPCTSARQSARISAASCAGTPSSGPGIARATGRASIVSVRS